MYAKLPKIAERWAKETTNFAGLPEHVKKTSLKDILRQQTGKGGSFPNLEKDKVEYPRQSAPDMPLNIKRRPGSPGEPAIYRPDWMPQVPNEDPYDKRPTKYIPPVKKMPKQLPKAVPVQNSADILQDILRKRAHIDKKL